VTSEIYLLEQVLQVGAAMVTSELRRVTDDLKPVGLATNMKRGPADESIQVAVVGSIWGFSDKTDGTVIDCIQFAE
jgi:hypothetical protein